MYKIKQQPEDFIVREIADHKKYENRKYAIFMLKKTNYTTQRAVEQLGRSLGIKPREIGYAGNKDKFAVTYQYISIPSQRKSHAESLHLKDIELTFETFTEEKIFLGNLIGNQFEIIIHEASTPPKEIDSFVNLFGEQRFSRNNHEIGKMIIKKDFKCACELLKESNLNYGMKDSLDENPTNYVGALRRIPLPILKIFVHSFQSFLWNKMAKTSEEEDIPLPGFDTDDEIAEAMLNEVDVRTSDFIIRQIPELSLEGEMRKRVSTIHELKVEKRDEKTYKLSFWLEKGCYATVAIDQIMNQE